MQSSIVKGALALGLALMALPAAAADFTATEAFASDSLTLSNLIGEITVTGHRGSGFEVAVHVRGADASPSNVRLESGRDRLSVVFPNSKRFVYPALDSNKVSFQSDDAGSGWLSYLLGTGRVEVRREGRGVEVWADVEVRVPAGGELKLRHGVGATSAREVEGDLDLDSRCGAVTVVNVDGDVRIDTGSGDVSVAGVNGALGVDTGSGDVELTGVVSSGDVSIDTGSGEIVLKEVSGRELNLDTGSGDVEASAIRVESALVDTGSGNVLLHFAEMGRGEFNVDTGSGAIQLGLPASASCRVRAETGSGGVSVDVAGATDMRRSESGNEVVFTLGGGETSVYLDTGSGAIRVLDAH